MHRVVICQRLSSLPTQREKGRKRKQAVSFDVPSFPSSCTLLSSPSSYDDQLTESHPFQQSHLEQNHLNPARPCCCCWSCLERAPPSVGRLGTDPASNEVLFRQKWHCRVVGEEVKEEKSMQKLKAISQGKKEEERKEMMAVWMSNELRAHNVHLLLSQLPPPPVPSR